MTNRTDQPATVAAERPVGRPAAKRTKPKQEPGVYWTVRHNWDGTLWPRLWPNERFAWLRLAEETGMTKAQILAKCDWTMVQVRLMPQADFAWLMGENGEFECPPERYFRGKAPGFWWRSELRRRMSCKTSNVRGNARLTAAQEVEDGRE